MSRDSGIPESVSGADIAPVDYLAKSHRRPNDAARGRINWAMFAPRQWLVWAGLGLLSVIWLLPVPLRDALGGAVGRLHYRYGRRHFRAGRRNLRACFPTMSADRIDHLLREHSMTQWCVWFDLPALWMSTPARLRGRTVFTGIEALQRRAAANKATVLLVCHNVALEHAAHALKSFLPMLGYYRPFKSPVLEWVFLRLRQRNGGYLLGRADPLHSLIKDVRNGWQLYQMIDEDLGRDAGEFAALFATDMCAVLSVGRMCRLAGADAVPVYSGYNRATRHYEVTVLPALDAFPADTDSATAAKITRCMESVISVSPQQFMWCQRMLQTRRDGQSSLYEGIRSASD